MQVPQHAAPPPQTQHPPTALQPRTTPLHPALCRPVLYAGVAPEILLFEVSAVFLLLFEVGLHVVTAAVSLLFAAAFHPFAAFLCARDPLMPQLYVRSLRGADHYVPAPRLSARVAPADPALPGMG
jgi:type IV secretory pathway TrbD component